MTRVATVEARPLAQRQVPVLQSKWSIDNTGKVTNVSKCVANQNLRPLCKEQEGNKNISERNLKRELESETGLKNVRSKVLFRLSLNHPNLEAEQK